MGIGSAVHERAPSAVTRTQRSPWREFIPRRGGQARVTPHLPEGAHKLAVTCAVIVMATLPCGMGLPEATTIVAAAMKLKGVPNSCA
jgi:hypothetical protein